MPQTDVEYLRLPIYQDELAQALGFAVSDLKSNRAGRVGPQQISYQYRAIARATAISLVLALVAAGSVAAAIAVGITTLIALAALVLAAGCVALIGVGAWYNVPVWKDVQAGAVSSVEGFVKGAERKTDIRTRYGMSIPVWTYYWTVDNGQRFWVPGKAYAVLTPARYRLFFLPSSRRIVGVEPIL